MVLHFGPDDALLIVDPQVDFCPGGSLPVPEADAIFPAINRAAAQAPLVIASRDWHPSDHCSFLSEGGPWPAHCRQHDPGAQFHPALDSSQIEEVFSKGSDPSREAYSAFDGTDLASWLRNRHVRHLFIAGLATDYCVRASVLDALSQGFSVVVLEDAVAAVNVHPGDGDRSLAEMRERGAALLSSGSLGGSVNKPSTRPDE
jgi:nicotinamidase/pyrazinamidase